MSDRRKMIIRLTIVFVFSFIVYEFINIPLNSDDPTIYYSFAKALLMGELPYKDFNMISTPLYPFIMSIGLMINNSFLTFLIEQTILMTIMFYYLFKMYDKKAWLILSSFCLFFFVGFAATYNFLCLFFITLIVYFEKKYPNKDYLIGFLIGLAILSKHTTGLLLLIPLVIICFKDKKKLLKRLIGVIIPIFIFGIYLLITNSYKEFIDLCFLGLFDFAGKNGTISRIHFYLAIILLICSFMLVIKNKDKKYNYYLLANFGVCIPLFDNFHTSVYFVSFMMICVDCLRVFEKRKLLIVTMVITITYTIMYLIALNEFDLVLAKNLKHYEKNYILKSNYDMSQEVFKYFDKYDDKNKIILSGHSLLYNITRDNKISYFDILNYGNHGYHGTDKLIKRIKKEKDLYIIVDVEGYNNTIKDNYAQYNYELTEYVMSNYKLIEEYGDFKVYYKK